jgi:hypothetical protein
MSKREKTDVSPNDQERYLRILDNALWRIAHRGDCEYSDEKNDQAHCDCPHCVAIDAIDSAKNWRYHGALYERAQSENWPREKKMHAAWMNLASGCGRGSADQDRLLSQILKDDHVPSARDWYVATSVIQWLATNVGMTVLEAAGFKYQQWDQDLADGPLFQRRQEHEASTMTPAKTNDASEDKP